MHQISLSLLCMAISQPVPAERPEQGLQQQQAKPPPAEPPLPPEPPSGEQTTPSRLEPKLPELPPPSIVGPRGEIVPPLPGREPSGLPPGSCHCNQLTLSEEDAGVVWRGPAPGPKADVVAHLIAPVLWFSPDEPLLENGAHIPAALPCDPPFDRAVVYYQLVELYLRKGAKQRRELGDATIADVEAGIIRFFFYYPFDVGLDGHQHDLEAADFYLTVEHLGAQCYQLRIEAVVGHAHGVKWYSNELTILPDTKLPLTILVEEGKHASATDRNSDGYFTPGYDVNERINDAWGVRDILGSSFLGGGSGYEGYMTKVRRRADRLFPPEPPIPRCRSILGPTEMQAEEHRGTYDLRPAASSPRCTDVPAPDKLRELIKGNEFGAEYPTKLEEVERVKRLFAPSGAKSFWPSVSLRWDRHLGLAFVLRGLDLSLVYVVPKVNYLFNRELSIEALVTRSASQVFNTYLSFGAAREEITRGFEWGFVSEAGLRFRFRAPGWVRIITLGHSFGGFRFGVRVSGFDLLARARLVVELGAGTW